MTISVRPAYFCQRATPPCSAGRAWLSCWETMSSPTNDGIGRMIGRLCLAFGVSMAFVAPALAELAMTGTPTTMRAGPTSKADVVQRIPRRAEIDLEKCARNWCRASWRGRFGYIPAEAVVLGPSPATLPGDEMPPPVLYASPTYITPPAWKWTGPYIGLNGGIGSSSW